MVFGLVIREEGDAILSAMDIREEGDTIVVVTREKGDTMMVGMREEVTLRW